VEPSEFNTLPDIPTDNPSATKYPIEGLKTTVVDDEFAPSIFDEET
jgi:hypothetical protein